MLDKWPFFRKSLRVEKGFDPSSVEAAGGAVSRLPVMLPRAYGRFEIPVVRMICSTV
jgi:hypothetical protein